MLHHDLQRASVYLSNRRTAIVFRRSQAEKPTAVGGHLVELPSNPYKMREVKAHLRSGLAEALPRSDQRNFAKSDSGQRFVKVLDPAGLNRELQPRNSTIV